MLYKEGLYMKKIFSIAAITILSIIAISVISLAFIKTGYNQLTVSNTIEVYYGSSHNTFYADSSNENSLKVYNKLKELYLKGTEESILSSLFQGAYSESGKASVEKSGWTFTTSSSSSAVYLKFTFGEQNLQTIKINDKTYEDENLSTSDKTIKYDAVWVEIVNSGSLTKITAYFRNTTNNNTSNYSDYRIKFLARHAELHSYIVELTEDGYLFS